MDGALGTVIVVDNSVLGNIKGTRKLYNNTGVLDKSLAQIDNSYVKIKHKICLSSL